MPASPLPTLPDPGRRLRVLVVITRGEAGGAQHHVLSLLRGLAAEVEFLLVVGQDDPFLAEQARALGVSVQVLPALQREIDLAIDLRAWRALRSVVRQARPDLVHTHSTKAGLLGRLAAGAEGVAAIHTAHSWAFSDGIARRRKALAVPLEIWAARATTRFITVSEADRALALRFRVAPDPRIRVIHNGVPDIPPALRARPEQGDPPVLAMVARMAPPKDHLLLLEALQGVAIPFRLWCIGDGPERPQVEAAIQARGLAGRVELLGERRDVAALLAQAHVATLVSRQEGFPLVVLEAMRAGLPVVASDVGGVREAVSPGATGELIARGDADGLRRALSRLLAEPGRRRAWGAAGRAAYEQRFTAEGMLARTLAVYREVVAAAEAPARQEEVR